MASPKDKPTKAPREFEVAYYTKELGRSLQRKMLQKRFDDFSDSHITASAHGDESSKDKETQAMPREDRAG